MSQSRQRHITVGISGGISAYRTLKLIRLLVKAGYQVKTIPTKMALEFVTPLSLEALSQNSCLLEAFDKNTGKINHIEEAYASDLIIIAPATCDFIAKMAHGFADEILLQTFLSFKGPVLIAPAMESNMWQNSATTANIQILKQRGIQVIDPEEGSLASGHNGMGRMAKIETIFENIASALTAKDFKGIKTIVTAGPTVENLDPVRYLSNFSSGKMGIALAKALAFRGAEVYLVHGPLQTNIPDLPEIKAYPVQSASQMYDSVLHLSDNIHLAILCAAVADFRPEINSNEKIKKTSDSHLNMTLVKNPDLLATLGNSTQKPFLVGFAAETSDLEKNALEKCRHKNADLICANLISTENKVFGADKNQVLIVSQDRLIAQSETKSKDDIAHFILDTILPKLVF